MDDAQELIKSHDDCIFCGKATSNRFIESRGGRACSKCASLQENKSERNIAANLGLMAKGDDILLENANSVANRVALKRPCCKCGDIIMIPQDLAGYEIKHGRVVGNICKYCWEDEDE